jgi:excisionase family DNA binding protein
MGMKTLVNIAELAETLRVSQSWIRNEAKAGRLPNVKAGQTRLFDLDAVIETLAARAVSSDQEERK